MRSTWTFYRIGGAVKIPEELRIPAFVFGLQAAMMAGWILIFLLMLPE
jgi:hypothetical protein